MTVQLERNGKHALTHEIVSLIGREGPRSYDEIYTHVRYEHPAHLGFLVSTLSSLSRGNNGILRTWIERGERMYQLRPERRIGRIRWFLVSEDCPQCSQEDEDDDDGDGYE